MFDYVKINDKGVELFFPVLWYQVIFSTYFEY